MIDSYFQTFYQLTLHLMINNYFLTEKYVKYIKLLLEIAEFGDKKRQEANDIEKRIYITHIVFKSKLTHRTYLHPFFVQYIQFFVFSNKNTT